MGLAAGRKASHPAADDLATSVDFWRGVVDGDGSLKMAAPARIPQLSLVGSSILVRQFATFLSGLFPDQYVPNAYTHSQSRAVQLVSVSGRRAFLAVDALYGDSPVEALPRKLARAKEILAWEPRVVHRYPWNLWMDGKTWTLELGIDYATPRRLWEAGRKVAALAELRLIL